MDKGNYSVDMMKKQAFVHELNNYLKIIKDKPVITDDDAIQYQRSLIVIDYLEKRIKQFDARNK